MKFLIEVLNNGTRWDAIGIDDGLVSTVELKMRNGRTMADWWFSGLNKEQELVALARFSIGLGLMTQENARAQLESVFSDVLRVPLFKLAALGGFSDAPNTGSTENKLALCLAHLDGHEQLGNIGSSQSIRVDAARQFQLIKSFGYSAAQKLISERSGLPKSTVDRRLFLARQSGQLQKMSDPDDNNNQ
jgi:hypothetical protein